MRTSVILATLLCLLGLVSRSWAQAPAPAAARPVGTNVAVIDISYVFENHLRFKRLMDEVKAEIERYDAEFQGVQKELSKRAEKLQEYKPSSAEYRQLEAELAKADADLKVQMQIKRRDILMKEAEIYFKAYNEIYEQVAMFSDRTGIGLVLRFDAKAIDPTQRDSILKGVNRPVVYQHQLNISDIILSRLNAGIAPAGVSRAPAAPVRPGLR